MSDPHYMVYGQCHACGRTFGFNPHLVPSVPINAQGEIDAAGDRKPICSTCITVINERRKAQGNPEWPVPEGAYEPVAGYMP